MASASGYNHHRFARTVLKKSRKWEPSMIVQLHHTNWRFADSPINFTYDGQMRPFLLALRAQVIPAHLIPFLYDIQPPVSFVDGCLVVEIQDFRKVPEVRSRVVMRPAAESLAQTIDIMLERKGEVWDERLALELESRIIAATSPPLYLGTSILATRNAVLAISLTNPATPSLSADGTMRSPEAGSSEPTSTTARMQKLLRAGERSLPFQPDFSILRLRERMIQSEAARQQREANKALRNGINGSDSNGSQEALLAAGVAAALTDGAGAGGNNGTSDNPPKKKKKKRPAPDDGDKDAPAAGAAAKKKKPNKDQDKAEEAAAKKEKEELEAKPKPKKKKKKQAEAGDDN